MMVIAVLLLSLLFPASSYGVKNPCSALQVVGPQGRPLPGGSFAVTGPNGEDVVIYSDYAGTQVIPGSSGFVPANSIIQFFGDPGVYKVTVSGGGVVKVYYCEIPASASAVVIDDDFSGPSGYLVKTGADVNGNIYGVRRANFSAFSAPTVNDDTGDGYSVGSFWFDIASDRIYMCTNATNGAAVWKEVSNQVGSSGITSLNGQTGATQTFNTSNTGSDFTISSSGNVHTFSIPDAGPSASRGLITNDIQLIAGNKQFSGQTIFSNNVLGNLDMSADSFLWSGDNLSDLLCVNGMLDSIGIGTCSPSALLDVRGAISAATDGSQPAITASHTSTGMSPVVEISGNSSSTIDVLAIRAGSLSDHVAFLDTIGSVQGKVRGGRFMAADGTAIGPSFSFVSDQNTGIWQPGNDTMSFSLGGTSSVTFYRNRLYKFGRDDGHWPVASSFDNEAHISLVGDASDLMNRVAVTATSYGNNGAPAVVLARAGGTTISPTTPIGMTDPRVGTFGFCAYDGDFANCTDGDFSGGVSATVAGSIIDDVRRDIDVCMFASELYGGGTNAASICTRHNGIIEAIGDLKLGAPDAGTSSCDGCLTYDSVNKVVKLSNGTINFDIAGRVAFTQNVSVRDAVVDGVQCTAAADTGDFVYGINCADDSSGVIYVNTVAPAKYDNGPFQLVVSAYNKNAAPSGDLSFDVSCQCDGMTSWGAAVNLDIPFSSAAQKEIVRSATPLITPGGTCTVRSLIRCRMVVDSVATTTQTSDAYILSEIQLVGKSNGFTD